jgi:hypothetical protein
MSPPVTVSCTGAMCKSSTVTTSETQQRMDAERWAVSVNMLGLQPVLSSRLQKYYFCSTFVDPSNYFLGHLGVSANVERVFGRVRKIAKSDY